jgi:DNA modification methylase
MVEILARKYFREGQTMLDPFVGSGTTLVQSNELGIDAIGYDISAFGTYRAFIEAVDEIGQEYKERIYREYLGIDPPIDLSLGDL